MVKVKKEEFIRRLLEEGFEYWGTREGYEIYGRTTYEGGVTSIGTSAEDWEEWHVYPDKAIHYYRTNRSVPGWSLCPYCGVWYTDSDSEWHEDCEPDVIYFDDSSSSSSDSSVVWIPDLFEKYDEVVIYDDEEDEAPYIARSPFEAPNECGRIVDSDEEEGWVEVIRVH